MKVISPKGIAQYPWLNQADTKFDELGAYKVNLIVDGEEANKFTTYILDGFKEEFGSKAKPGHLPWKAELDDQGNATGNVVFNFVVKNKMKKDGTLWKRNPEILNSDLEKTEDVIGAGSEIRIATEAYFWDTGSKKGIQLQPIKVQILE